MIMFCKNCGFKLEDNANFCEQCGTKVVVDTDTISSAAAPVEENFGTTPEGSLVCGSPAPAAEPVSQPEPAAASDEPIVSQDTHEDSVPNGPLLSNSPAPETDTNFAGATVTAAAFGTSDTAESIPKKKNMKKILIPVIAVVVLIGLIFTFFGATKDPLVGKWYEVCAVVDDEYIPISRSELYTVTFKSNGSLEFYSGDLEYTGDWEYICDNDGYRIYDITLVSDTGTRLYGNISKNIEMGPDDTIELFIILDDLIMAYNK